MHAYQAVLPASQPVSRSEWQQYSTQRCIVDDFGTVVEDDITFARSSGKPKKNQQDIRVGRPYQYVSLRCLFCMKGDERVSFFVSTLKVHRLSDHPVMFVVVLHHHAFFHHVRCRSFCCQLLVHNYCPSSIRS